MIGLGILAVPADSLNWPGQLSCGCAFVRGRWPGAAHRSSAVRADGADGAGSGIVVLALADGVELRHGLAWL